MSEGLAEKPLDSRPLRIVADCRMMFASLSKVKMSVASEAGTFLVLGGGELTSPGGSTSCCFLPFL